LLIWRSWIGNELFPMLASLSEVNKELLADLCTTGANLNDFEPSTQDIVGTAFAVPSA